MKLSRTLSLLALTTFVCSAIVLGNGYHGAEGSSVKQYEDFHHLLRELQHDALPSKDFARIRSKAGELVKLGEAIVQLGVPQGTAAANVETFKKELKKFDEALVKYKGDAKSGTDDQLKVSYLAVHDSFETLADMLPR